MPSNLLTRFRGRATRAVKADPKKAGVLGVLLVILVCLWARSMGGPGPAAASAGQGFPDARLLAEPDAAPRPAAASRQLEEWSREPLPPVTRDLFALNLDFYRRDAPGAGAAGNGFWDRLQKSMDDRTEKSAKRLRDVKAVCQMAARLRLQSTVMGKTPTALVDGKLIREGDSIGGFKVLRIMPRGLIVEQGGAKLQVLFKDSAAPAQ